MDTEASGWFLRAPVPADAGPLTELIRLCDVADVNAPGYVSDFTVEDLQARWRRAGFRPEADSWVAVSADGVLVGYTDVRVEGEEVQTFHMACVHPAHRGRGIGAALARRAEERARQCARSASWLLTAWAFHGNASSRRLLERRGFTTRGLSLLGMEIDLQDAPPPPAWPAGIAVRTFVPGQDDDALRAAVDEAFERPFTRWDDIYGNHPAFDPTLWHLAWDGAELAGAILSDPVPEIGYVDVLGVRPPWRRRGLGTALLRHAFADFYGRGLRRAGLSVSGADATGARRLYERAGMRPVVQLDAYAKPLR